jgi:hypothetical protein
MLVVVAMALRNDKRPYRLVGAVVIATVAMPKRLLAHHAVVGAEVMAPHPAAIAGISSTPGSGTLRTGEKNHCRCG